MVESTDRFPALNEYEADEYDSIDELENLFKRAKGEISNIADEVDEHIERVREAKEILRESHEFDDQSHPEFFENIDEGVEGMKNMKERYVEVVEYQYSGESSPENSELDESEFIHEVMYELKRVAERFEMLDKKIGSFMIGTDNLKEIQISLNKAVFGNEEGSSYDDPELSKKDISICDVSKLDNIREEHEKALRYAICLDNTDYKSVDTEDIEFSSTDVSNEAIAESLTTENTE